MPTGYTAKLYDGEDVSFKNFVFSCSRAFGARISEKENDLNAAYEPRTISTYSIESLKKDIEDYNTRLTYSVTNWRDEYFLNLQKGRENAASANHRARELRKRYSEMLIKVNDWTPPTPDHTGLKEFMIHQLTDALKHDCSEYEPTFCTDWRAYRAQTMEALQDNIRYYAAKITSELESARESNEWVQTLAESLE